MVTIIIPPRSHTTSLRRLLRQRGHPSAAAPQLPNEYIEPPARQERPQPRGLVGVEHPPVADGPMEKERGRCRCLVQVPLPDLHHAQQGRWFTRALPSLPTTTTTTSIIIEAGLDEVLNAFEARGGESVVALRLT
jgi:hypothetical protein